MNCHDFLFAYKNILSIMILLFQLFFSQSLGDKQSFKIQEINLSLKAIYKGKNQFFSSRIKIRFCVANLELIQNFEHSVNVPFNSFFLF